MLKLCTMWVFKIENLEKSKNIFNISENCINIPRYLI